VVYPRIAGLRDRVQIIFPPGLIVEFDGIALTEGELNLDPFGSIGNDEGVDKLNIDSPDDSVICRRPSMAMLMDPAPGKTMCDWTV
jgi:hypothetical protein